ncbi:MAG: MMPL family transporter [Asgard group archaeon]|nr:MMPL family transporter [Asgard group archaeon]
MCKKSKTNKNNEKNSNNGKKKKLTEAFFEKLGRLITKRYKLILIISLLSAVAAIYPAILLSGELSYNDTDFLPKNLEGDIGNAILREQFPEEQFFESTLIVMDSDIAITDSENLDYIYELKNRINDSIYYDYVDGYNSIVDVYEQVVSAYWQEMNATYDMIYDYIYSNISYANQAMHVGANELDQLFQQIAGLYFMTWFNFSRTYFYGEFDANLFNDGPLNSTVQQTIAVDTNFTTGFSIQPNYIQLTYQQVVDNLPDHTFVNDQFLNLISYGIANSSLSMASGLSEADYMTQIYSFLQIYYQNWTNFFDLNVTQPGYSFVNGTDINQNEYLNDTIPNAYISQSQMLQNLSSINNMTLDSISVKDLILLNSGNFFDLNGTGFEDFIDPSFIPVFMELIYDLGESPSPLAIDSLTTSIATLIINQIINDNPPENGIESFVANPQYRLIVMWVLSEDGKSAIIHVSYNVSSITDFDEKDSLLVEMDAWVGDIAHELVTELNMTQTRVYHTGEIFLTESIVEYSEEAASSIDWVAAILVFAVLLIIFASLVAPAIPLLAIGLSIAIACALLFWIAQAMPIHYLGVIMLSVISMGAGVDYCIFIYSRFSEELEKGQPKEVAVQKAVEFAGESVFHSGLTVLIGFGALIIPNFPMLRIFGISMMIGTTFSIICALLVVPSLLMLLGKKVYWPKFLKKILRPYKFFQRKKKKDKTEMDSNDNPDGQTKQQKRIKKPEKDEKPKQPLTLRFGKFITKHGLKFFIGTLILVAPFVYFTATMDTSSDFLSMLPEDFEGNQAMDILSEKMSFGNPTAVTVVFTDLPDDPILTSALFDTDRLCIRILPMDHVNTIRTTVRPLGNIAIPYSNNDSLAFYEDLVNDFIGKDRRTFYMEIYLDVDSYSDEAIRFVAQLDDTITEVITENNIDYFESASIYITGVAKDFYDMQFITNSSYPIIVPVVLVGVFLVLFFLFGSYFTPIRLILTIGISVVITLGMVHLIYGIGFGVPILWLLPIMMFSILMGLGLDYDIFLVSRIKEYCQAGMTDKDAIAYALQHTSTIITSCGLVMAAAFSSLMFSNLWHINELGFAFTLSIILDATLVRLIIVPSIMVLLEKLNWKGPKRFQKVYRVPEVTAAMKVIGDNIGIEIYDRELKETLDTLIEEELEDQEVEEKIDRMIPIIEETIGKEKITTEIRSLMIEKVTAILQK